jgi:hypothetical protein
MKTLNDIDIPDNNKKILKKEIRKWIKYIKIHMKEMHSDEDSLYHKGEISFAELFFNIQEK